MRLVPLPDGVLTSPPVYFDGTGYLRIAAAPYNTPDDYDRLGDTARTLTRG